MHNRVMTWQFALILFIILSIYGGSLVLIELISPMPKNLGVTNGQLAPCPKSPNCVSTQAPQDDRTHYIEPIPFTGDVATVKINLLRVIQEMPRTTIITEQDDYLHVEFRTQVLRFIDDVEFYIDADAGVIHFRSASRLGKGDGGTNRRRMESFRKQYSALVGTPDVQ